jgi:hypothetical protein
MVVAIERCRKKRLNGRQQHVGVGDYRASGTTQKVGRPFQLAAGGGR